MQNTEMGNRAILSALFQNLHPLALVVKKYPNFS